ncbi:MAG TPA: TMEM165/GDT1 family protein [bacterium]
MNWQVFATTFVTIFLAEIGDKTQFAAVAASAETRATLSVLLAVVLALSLAGALGVLAGRLLGDIIPPAAMRWLAGSLFIAVGIWVLAGR